MSSQRVRATVRGKHQVTLPREVVAALRVKEGDEVEFVIGADGAVTVRGMTLVPTDQAWFWDPEWQAGEREASGQAARGDVEVSDSAKGMFDGLER